MYPCAVMWVNFPPTTLSWLDLPPSTPIGTKEFHAASLRLSCQRACVLAPLSPLCCTIYWCLLFSSDDWIIFLRVYFYVMARGQGAFTPWQFLVPYLTHALLEQSGAIHASLPLPFPPCLFYTFPFSCGGLYH